MSMNAKLELLPVMNADSKKGIKHRKTGHVSRNGRRGAGIRLPRAGKPFRGQPVSAAEYCMALDLSRLANQTYLILKAVPQSGGGGPLCSAGGLDDRLVRDE